MKRIAIDMRCRSASSAESVRLMLLTKRSPAHGLHPPGRREPVNSDNAFSFGIDIGSLNAPGSGHPIGVRNGNTGSSNAISENIRFLYDIDRLDGGGSSPPVRDGTDPTISSEIDLGPPRYLAHRRLMGSDGGSSPPVRDGTDPTISNEIDTGPPRYLAHRLLMGSDGGSSPPVRDGTDPTIVIEIDTGPPRYLAHRLLMESDGGSSPPVRDGTDPTISNEIDTGPPRYLAHRRLMEGDGGSSPPVRDGTDPSMMMILDTCPLYYPGHWSTPPGRNRIAEIQLRYEHRIGIEELFVSQW